MNGFKNVLAALIIFITGVLFAYSTWPFFTSFITAMDNAGSSFADWEYISGIAWLGLISIYFLWIIVVPYYHAFMKDETP